METAQKQIFQLRGPVQLTAQDSNHLVSKPPFCEANFGKLSTFTMHRGLHSSKCSHNRQEIAQKTTSNCADSTVHVACGSWLKIKITGNSISSGNRTCLSHVLNCAHASLEICLIRIFLLTYVFSRALLYISLWFCCAGGDCTAVQPTAGLLGSERGFVRTAEPHCPMWSRTQETTLS